MELVVYNAQGGETKKKVTLKSEIFEIEPNSHAIYLDVKQYLANQRQGTHKTKERNEVAGSTRKIKKQKGTGGARAGAITSPLFVGGGTTFGPQPRSYSFKLNKKLKKLARKSALSIKTKENKIKVIEDFTFEAPKTKSFLAIAEGLKVTGQRVLVVLPQTDRNVALSVRNIQRVKVVPATDINTYDLMNAGTIIVAESSIAVINEMLA